MADLLEQSHWDEGVYQFEETDAVQGGPDGIDNKPLKNLTNRTRYLKDEVEKRAPLIDAALTGEPTAPTPPVADDGTRISTTAFVQAVVAAAVQSILNAPPGTLDTLNELAAALGDDPNFATTVMTQLAAKAPLANAALTGTPTAPTPPAGTNSTRIATAAFVQAAINALDIEPLTATEILNLLKTVDGSGSGLNADVLDGLSSSSFLRSDAGDYITGLLQWARQSDEQMRIGVGTGAIRNILVSFYDGEVTRRGYIQTLPDRLRIGRDGGAIMDLYGSGEARLNGNKVWHDGNVSTTYNTNGQIKFPNGTIFKFGYSGAGSFGRRITFAESFPSVMASVVVTPINNGGGAMASIDTQATTGFNAYVDRHDALDLTTGFYWMAIGA